MKIYLFTLILILISGCATTTQQESHLNCVSFQSQEWASINDKKLKNELIKFAEIKVKHDTHDYHLFKSKENKIGLCETFKKAIVRDRPHCGNYYMVFEKIDGKWMENDERTFTICG